MNKQELLEYAKLTWNSIEPIDKYDKNKSTQLEGLNQIRSFINDISQKEKDISNTLQQFVKLNNISKLEENEISESIKDLFSNFIESISNKE